MCGGNRHALDTKGFCRDCKVKLGIPVAPLKSQSSQEDRKWEAKRQIIADVNEVGVKVEVLDFVWGQIEESIRHEIYVEIWDRLPATEKSKWISIAIGRQKKPNV